MHLLCAHQCLVCLEEDATLTSIKWVLVTAPTLQTQEVDSGRYMTNCCSWYVAQLGVGPTACLLYIGALIRMQGAPRSLTQHSARTP